MKIDDRVKQFVIDVARLDPRRRHSDAWDDPEDALDQLPQLCAEARKIARACGFYKDIRWEDSE